VCFSVQVERAGHLNLRAVIPPFWFFFFFSPPQRFSFFINIQINVYYKLPLSRQREEDVSHPADSRERGVELATCRHELDAIFILHPPLL